MRNLIEGFEYRDLEGYIDPVISIDEYAAKVGEDDGVITLAFTVKSRVPSEELSAWFERGYDWILDAEVSEGESSKNKFLVFVEIMRRTEFVEQLFELIEDLETLTGLKIKDWSFKYKDDEYDITRELINQLIPMSPKKYRLANPTQKEDEQEPMNEMREIAGLSHENKIVKSSELKTYLAKAGL